MSRTLFLSLSCLLVAGCPETVTPLDTPGGGDVPVLDAPRLDAGPEDAPTPMDAPTPLDVLVLMDGPSPELDGSLPLLDAPFPDIRIAAPDVPLGDVSFSIPDVPIRRDVGGLACGSAGSCAPGSFCCFRLGICVPEDCPDCCPITP